MGKGFVVKPFKTYHVVPSQVPVYENLGSFGDFPNT